MLCVQASSVSSERVFSKGGLIVEKRRCSLSSSSVSLLMFLSCNISNFCVNSDFLLFSLKMSSSSDQFVQSFEAILSKLLDEKLNPIKKELSALHDDIKLLHEKVGATFEITARSELAKHIGLPRVRPFDLMYETNAEIIV